MHIASRKSRVPGSTSSAAIRFGGGRALGERHRFGKVGLGPLAEPLERLVQLEERLLVEILDPVVCPQECAIGFGDLDDAEAVARDLGPDVWLRPMDEGAAHLDVDAGERRHPRPSAEAITSFEEDHSPAA
jgi:hypothetical protein